MAASEEDKRFSDDETGPTASTSDRVEIASLTYTKDAAKDKDSDRVAVPQDFFVYIGPASKPGSSLYRCLKCPEGFSNKPLSCNNSSRYNLKKHVEVRTAMTVYVFNINEKFGNISYLLETSKITLTEQ
jgi:hypothetical protein